MDAKKLPSARFDDILNFTFEVEAHSWFSAAGEAQGMGFKLVRGSIVLYLDDEPCLILCTSLG